MLVQKTTRSKGGGEVDERARVSRRVPRRERPERPEVQLKIRTRVLLLLLGSCTQFGQANGKVEQDAPALLAQRDLAEPLATANEALDRVRSIQEPGQPLLDRVSLDLTPPRPARLLETFDDLLGQRLGGDDGSWKGTFGRRRDCVRGEDGGEARRGEEGSNERDGE